MKKLKNKDFNFFKKIFDKKYSGKLVTGNKLIKISHEISRFNFLKNKRYLCLVECFNTPESILSYISIMSYGSVPLLINENLNEVFFKKYILKFLPDYIVTKRKIVNKNYFIFDKIHDIFFYKSKKIYNKKLNKELAILLPTSGSTGSSKMVRISYKNLYSNSNDICNFLKIKKNDIAITTMPFSYTYGMSIINTHVMKGANIYVYSGSVIQKNFFEILQKFKISTFGGVPYIYELLIKIGLNRIKNKYLKYITHAGGAMDKKLLLKIYNFCKKNDLEFISMYGSSEETSRMSYLSFKNMKKKIGSIGKGLQKSFYLLDEEDNEIFDAYKTGELVFQGENVSMGYANSWKDLTLGDKNFSILKTGDEGYFDKDGFFYIQGRKNRYVKFFGHRISLDEIEKNLNKKFKNCFVKFIDEKFFVFSNKTYDFTELNNFIFKRFNINKKMVKFVKIEKIPYTSNNKIDYKKLNVN